jgi:hypothetical protein
LKNIEEEFGLSNEKFEFKLGLNNPRPADRGFVHVQFLFRSP